MESKLNIILLSGGSGKRLWPLSNDIRSKQFIKILKNENGSYESMIQRIYRQIKSIDRTAVITIATSRSQVSAIHNQLGNDVDISVEPCKRDTFPAIALACSYLHDIKKIDLHETVLVCPVDPFVDGDYFKALHNLFKLAKTGDANLSLLGVEPTYPSEKYGYIIPENSDNISKVASFREKPDSSTAEKYIRAGGLWNGGVFAFKLKYILDTAHKLIDFTDYADLFSKYNTLQKISFDFAVAEHEKNMSVMRFSGEWKDLGTWNTLTEAMEESTIGNVILGEDCENVHAINELDIPIIITGIKNAVVTASPEGVLVSDKNKSSFIKPYVDEIDQQIMFAEKSWGSYKVINVSDNSLTINVTLTPGNKMNYHSHNLRDEIWNVISGTGCVIVDGVKQQIKTGDVIKLPAGCKHTVIAETELQMIEVQLGKDINVSDKQKYKL